MRALRFLNLGILAVLIASSAVLYAQDEKQQEEKPRQEEPKRRAEPKQQPEPNRQAEPSRQQEPGRQPEAKPESRQDETKAPRQEEARPARPQQQEQRQCEMNRSQPETGRQDQGRQENRQEAGQQQDRARAGGNGDRIPEDRFRAQFGREHHFAMRRPEVVEGRPRFEYGGYTFVLVDAWPPEWAYSDDCYIDYVDGDYFLFNLRHPEMRLALMVVM